MRVQCRPPKLGLRRPDAPRSPRSCSVFPLPTETSDFLRPYALVWVTAGSPRAQHREGEREADE